MTDTEIRWIGGIPQGRADPLPSNPLVMQVTGTDRPRAAAGEEEFALTIAMRLPSGGAPVGVLDRRVGHPRTGIVRFLAVQHAELPPASTLTSPSIAVAQAPAALLVRIRAPLSEQDPWPDVDDELGMRLRWRGGYRTLLRRELQVFARRIVIGTGAGFSITENWAFRQNSDYFAFKASLIRWLFLMSVGVELQGWEVVEALKLWAATTSDAEDHLYELGLLEQSLM